jgi:hypothetical protein
MCTKIFRDMKDSGVGGGLKREASASLSDDCGIGVFYLCLCMSDTSLRL